MPDTLETAVVVASAGNRRLVQIGSVQVEVDLASARPAHCFRIGDTVRVVEKDYSSFHNYTGFIVEYLEFRGKPAVVLAVVKSRYGSSAVEFVIYDGERDNIQVVDHHVQGFSLDETLSLLDGQIANDRAALEDLMRRRNALSFAFGRKDDRIETILVDARRRTEASDDAG